MKEKWIPVVGFEPYYEVSNIGRVKSLYRIVPIGKNNTREISYIKNNKIWKHI